MLDDVPGHFVKTVVCKPPVKHHCSVRCVISEEHCVSPMHVSYRRAHTRDFAVTVESGVSDVISGLIDPTQALRGSWKRWQLPTDPNVIYTFRVKFQRPCADGWRVERLSFTVEGVAVFQLAVGNYVVVRKVRL